MPSQREASGPLALRPLGSTGLQVTPICIGTAPLGSMPETFSYEVPEERAIATIRAFFAGPINFLDTAASYGDGESERRIGIVLHELGGLPSGFVLATKADRDLQTGVFTGAQMGAVSSAACVCWVWSNYNSSISTTPSIFPLKRRCSQAVPSRCCCNVKKRA